MKKDQDNAIAPVKVSCPGAVIELDGYNKKLSNDMESNFNSDSTKSSSQQHIGTNQSLSIHSLATMREKEADIADADNVSETYDVSYNFNRK